MATLAFWLLLLAFVGAFAAQVARRVQLIAAAPNTFSLDHLGVPRPAASSLDVVLQRADDRERPVAGLACTRSCSGASSRSAATRTVEFLYGLGIVDLTHAAWFHAYRLALTPFAVGGARRHRSTCSIRRAFVRPVGARHDTCRSSRSSSRCSSRR